MCEETNPSVMVLTYRRWDDPILRDMCQFEHHYHEEGVPEKVQAAQCVICFM